MASDRLRPTSLRAQGQTAFMGTATKQLTVNTHRQARRDEVGRGARVYLNGVQTPLQLAVKVAHVPRARRVEPDRVLRWPIGGTARLLAQSPQTVLVLRRCLTFGGAALVRDSTGEIRDRHIERPPIVRNFLDSLLT